MSSACTSVITGYMICNTYLDAMGGSQSYPGLTEDVLEDHATLTYLSKGAILHLMKKMYSINPEKMNADFNHRFSKEEIVNKFEVLKNNPFQDRLFRVFSSKRDDRFSFEDLLDLCSAMSSECPCKVKAAWAFRVFDLDEDNQISESDIAGILDRLVCAPHGCQLANDEKSKVANVILEELKLDITTRSIGMCEFEMMMSRIPEFQSTFYFRL